MQKKSFYILSSIIIGIALCFFAKQNTQKAKYIFYFIGDGMSMAHVNLAELSTYGRALTTLNIRNTHVTGIARTQAKNREITCSAAAATGLASGQKGLIDHISVTENETPLKTIAEICKENGMKVGIISSASLDHATPACFYAHTNNRNNYHIISEQLLNSGFDYFAGGAVRLNNIASHKNIKLEEAFHNYKTEAENKGFKFIRTKEDFDNTRNGENKPVIATLNILTGEEGSKDGFSMPYNIDLHTLKNDDDKLSLADFTAKGIEILNNDNGFFMLIEGGKIDWACHANDAASCLHELIAFDKAIGEAIKFYKQHPDETLIVITGDHETGGLGLGFAGTGYESAFDILLKQKLSFQLFSDSIRSKIKEEQEFNEILAFTFKNFGFTDNDSSMESNIKAGDMELSNLEMEQLRYAYNKIKNKEKYTEKEKYNGSYGGHDPYTSTCLKIINAKAGIGFTSYSHTATSVPVFVIGSNENLFNGFYENTDIPRKILKAAHIKDSVFNGNNVRRGNQK